MGHTCVHWVIKLHMPGKFWFIHVYVSWFLHLAPCEDGWTYLGSRCYITYKPPMAVQGAAEVTCVGVNAHIVSLHSMEHIKHVQSKLQLGFCPDVFCLVDP